MFLWTEPRSLIRKISSQKVLEQQEIFLSFDDGPCKETTPAILDLLKKHQGFATFFVIGKTAESEFDLMQRIQNEGHSVYSHSIDHRYGHYFQSSDHIEKWLLDSVNHLNRLLKNPVWAFRPPAGVLNPPLIKASQKLSLPLVLWNQRFFDSLFLLSPKKIDRKLDQFVAGDIILLHDRQKIRNQKAFLIALEYMIRLLKEKGFKLSPLLQNDLTQVPESLKTSPTA